MLEEKIRVLLVEDDEDTQIIYKRAISLLGYQVEVVDSAEECLEKLFDIKPYIVISDINLKRMNGGELLKRIGEVDPSVIRIAMTGGVLDKAYEDFLYKQVGVHSFFQKGTTFEGLEASLEKATLTLTALLSKFSGIEGFIFPSHIKMSRYNMPNLNIIKPGGSFFDVMFKDKINDGSGKFLNGKKKRAYFNMLIDSIHFLFQKGGVGVVVGGGDALGAEKKARKEKREVARVYHQDLRLSVDYLRKVEKILEVLQRKTYRINMETLNDIHGLRKQDFNVEITDTVFYRGQATQEGVEEYFKRKIPIMFELFPHNPGIPWDQSDTKIIDTAYRLGTKRDVIFVKNTPYIAESDPYLAAEGQKRPRRIKTITAGALKAGEISRIGADGEGGHLIEDSAVDYMIDNENAPAVVIYPLWDPPNRKNYPSKDYSRILPGKEVKVEFFDN